MEPRMNNVLIDNWSLENIIHDLDNIDLLLRNPTFHNILEALFLWDNIYFPKNEFSLYWNLLLEDSVLKNFLIPLEDNEEFEEESRALYNTHYRQNHYTENIACGAIRYIMLSAENRIDYLPCPQRSEFIQESNINKLLFNYGQMPVNGRNNIPMPRKELWSTLDRELKKYYIEFEKQYSNSYYEVELPVLANYIIYIKPDNINYFEYARSLKRKLFADILIKYIEKTEKDIANGNFVANNVFKNDMKDIVDSICSNDRRLITVRSAKLFPTLSYSFYLNDIRKINFIFARKIVKYAVTNK